jgi:beta-glucosidase
VHTTTPTPFADAVARVRAGADPDTEARALLDQLTREERLQLLDGDAPFWAGMAEMMLEGYNLRPISMGRIDRLGIPGVQFVDGPRGVVVGQSTAFPVSMARGATWDPAVEERVGEAIGAELRAQGGNFFGGVCINLPRHPGWGRVQETYSEDPLLLGELGAAAVRGVQHHAIACLKHFALNSMENARFSVDVTIEDEPLHELFLAHFRRGVEAGAMAVMSSYNSVNGTWAGQNRELLTDVLREQWGFEGFVISDFIWGLRDAAASLAAGLDVEAPFRQQRGAWLEEGIAAGRAEWADVDRAGLRILRTQLALYATRDQDEPSPDVVAGPEHRALAREVAARSMVLLRNTVVDRSPVLPLDPTVSRVAVLGRLADVANTGDHGSSDVRAPHVVSAVEGLRTALGAERVEHVPTGDRDAELAAAAAAEVAVVVVGFTAEDEGEYVGGDVLTRPDLAVLYPEPADEDDARRRADLVRSTGEGMSVVGGGAAGGDRVDLHLRPADVELVRAVCAVNPRTVVVMVAAGAVQVEEWVDEAGAVLLAWYSGMEGGHALADVLLGTVDASGRLPFCVPRSAEDLPWFDKDATAITYDRWFGQRLLDRRRAAPEFPLGFGLSYTSWRLTAVGAERTGDEAATVAVRVANTGTRDGRHVVQVYGRRDDERFLVGFASVPVPAGGEVDVDVPVSLRPLGRWDRRTGAILPPTGRLHLEVGSHAGDPRAQALTV